MHAFDDLQRGLEHVRQLYFHDDGSTPNSHLPVLHYHLRSTNGAALADAFGALFSENQWIPLWRAGIYDYHHYHSTAHEALAVVHGRARVTLGGESGQTLSLEPGDVLVECSKDFLVVGAYPRGQEDYDIQRPGSGNHADSQGRIARVPLPEADPLGGVEGPLMTAWGPQVS